MEPWTAHFYAKLRDPSVRVRKNTLMVSPLHPGANRSHATAHLPSASARARARLCPAPQVLTHLILNDMIKVRGQARHSGPVARP
jgi:hypothetical protein